MTFIAVAAFGAGLFLLVAGVKGWSLSEVTKLSLGDISPF